jgi:PmbA protein
LKKVVRLHVSEEREHKTIVTNRGVSLSAESTGTGFLVELLAEEDGQTEVAWDGVGRRFGGDIPFEKVVLDAAQTAVQSLGGKPLPSGLYTVLLHPRVGTQLLSLLAQALSAEAVQTNRSFLRNRLGEKVGSSDITVLDDPGLPRGAASVLFDDEGAPSQKLAMIEKGVLKNTFFDLRTAKKQGAAPNGRGFRASLAAAPAPHPTNLYIASGPHSLDHLLSSEKKVFLLHDIMGLHMAEPVTGEFSLGAAGFLYENGRLARPVRGMTMAGTVGGLLENATAAGNEIHWASSMGAPYVLVKNITLSGN